MATKLTPEEQLGSMSQYATRQDYEMSRKRMIRQGYEQLLKGLALLIDATPSGDLRNAFTDMNIHALALAPSIEQGKLLRTDNLQQFED